MAEYGATTTAVESMHFGFSPGRFPEMKADHNQIRTHASQQQCERQIPTDEGVKILAATQQKKKNWYDRSARWPVAHPLLLGLIRRRKEATDVRHKLSRGEMSRYDRCEKSPGVDKKIDRGNHSA